MNKTFGALIPALLATIGAFAADTSYVYTPPPVSPIRNRNPGRWRRNYRTRRQLAHRLACRGAG